MMKILKSKIFIWTIASLFVIGFVFIHFIGPHLVVGRRANDRPYPVVSDYELQVDSFSTKTKDGLTVKSLFCHTKTDTVLSTVLFVHGIGSRKERFLPMANLLAENGIQSILVDLRAHGESEGDYVTYGYYETDDLSEIIHFTDSVYHIDKMGIWGQSLGAAISLQLLAQNKRLNFGIIESTYSTFDQVVHDYSKRMIGIPLGFLNDYVIWRAQSVGNFDKTGIHPIDACAKIEQPILYVHGTEDDRISIKYGKDNFKALKTLDKELLLMEGADHLNVWDKGGESYTAKCISFIIKKSSENP